MTCKAYETSFQRYTEGILEPQPQEDLQQHKWSHHSLRFEVLDLTVLVHAVGD